MQRDSNDLLRFAATDIANHLACRHLTQLSRMETDGEIDFVYRDDPVLEELIRRGKDHERAYVQLLKGSGKLVVDLTVGSGRSDRTLDAMRRGIDVIVQPELKDDRWLGYADLLLKVDTSSELGDWSYEVADTKLALTTRGGTVLQLCLYSELLGRLQGRVPERMVVVKPGDPFEIEYFRFDDYAAYYRLVKRRLQEAAEEGEDTYPEPVAHCEICNWWPVCDQRRRDDDHLTFVAGIQKPHVAELTEQGRETLEKLAGAAKPLDRRPKRGSMESFERVHRQAQIQYEGRTEDTYVWEPLEQEEGRGFAKLPEPDAGDVFFDFEGDRHAPDGGLEYLFGYVLLDAEGQPKYKDLWGLNRKQEKATFQKFIDEMMERWVAHPGMHIYHYAHYEPTAIRKLAMRHGTREDEVDRLLRGNRFVDLYAVVRQGLIASVESYSIKYLEPFYGYERRAELRDARVAMQRFEQLLNAGLEDELLESDQDVVREYNKDDCVSTLRLRDWLEELRSTEIEAGSDISRPKHGDGAASEASEERSAEVAAIIDRLVEGIPEEERSRDQQARWLLTWLLEYFRREQKCVWWEHFRLRDLAGDDILEEPAALAGLEFEEGLPPKPRARTPVHRYRFPPQDAQIDVGATVYEVGAEGSDGGVAKPTGKVEEIDPNAGYIDIKKSRAAADIHPAEVFRYDNIRPHPMPAALQAFGELVATSPPDTSLKDARYALLSREIPRFRKLSLPMEGENVDVAIRLAAALDDSVLPIQGPPGAGKTYVGSHMIATLAKRRKRIGVTAVSHKVISNLLSAVHDRDNSVPLAHKWNSDSRPEFVNYVNDAERAVSALDKGSVVGGTAFLWSHSDLEQQLDYLFIDEAGQMSLAMAIAAGRAAKNFVLLGDPQQLEQPQQGSHPEGADIAALNHLLDGHQTIPPDRGLFLESTWRLNPAICRFTSEQYYERRLSSRGGLERQIVTGDSERPESGLVFVPVEHTGNQIESLEEAELIQQFFNLLLDGTHKWRNSNNRKKRLTVNDILVVAPYNAQVSLLQNMLPKGARVGTVDKFQGQEAPVVIYSVTSSSSEDAPRGMQFLYSPNRLNVATSRARCLVILVGSRTVFTPDCNTPEQIALANGFCRYLEMATTLRDP